MVALSQSKRHAQHLRALKKAPVYVVLSIGALVMAIPFLFLVSSSLKTDTEILAYPPTLLPKVWDWANYPETWQEGDFSLYFRNSAYIALVQSALVLFTCALSAYTFARMQFPGRQIILLAFLSTMMLPGQVTLIPVYVLIKRIPFIGGNNLWGEGGTGMINTFAGIIIPGYVSASGIFLLRQFMSTLPRELDDAARIDGCGEFGIFWRIILPLCMPALATLGIMTFQGSWNNFLWPLLVGQKRELWTLQVAISRFRISAETGVIEWPQLFAGTVIATLPVMIVFLFAQRYFVEGIALTGLK